MTFVKGDIVVVCGACGFEDCELDCEGVALVIDGSDGTPAYVHFNHVRTGPLVESKTRLATDVDFDKLWTYEPPDSWFDSGDCDCSYRSLQALRDGLGYVMALGESERSWPFPGPEKGSGSRAWENFAKITELMDSQCEQNIRCPKLFAQADSAGRIHFQHSRAAGSSQVSGIPFFGPPPASGE